MGAIRKLYVDLQVRSADAVKSLVAFGRTFQTVDKVVAQAATSIERNADRVAAALARVSSGAAQVRAAGGGGGGGGGAAKSGAPPTRASKPDNTAARVAGLADGTKTIRDATAALGPLATKSDRAKAAVADLAAQVARNRKEMADLRAETVKNGDSSGTLKARMQGLSVATGQASVALQKARKELRDVDGGLIDAVKNAGKLRDKFGALQVAAGNLISGGVTAAFTGMAAAITGATKKAIDFESAFADVKKVLPDGTTEEQIKGVEKSVVDLSRRVAVDGPEGAAKLNAALLQTGLYTTETLVPAAEAAAKIGVAFDIGAGEAGDALAKLRVGGNLTQEQVEKLAGTFNHLSNNMPATAKQIIEAEGRVISIGNAANISAEQTTALVTAMIATGADADVAATGTKNFIRALASGEAATKKQSHAFKTLGLDARDVAKGLTAGGKAAEDTVKDVVTRIGDLGKVSREKVLPVLIELFGSESISSIGPLATNIELLTKSFDLAGDSAAAAVSVEKEYEARSKTTANAIQLLKNNVSALAIELGNQLLPYINQVVDFLTSKEGQEWGRKAVEALVKTTRDFASELQKLWPVIKEVASVLLSVVSNLGAANLAMGLFAGKIATVASSAVSAFTQIAGGATGATSKVAGLRNVVTSMLGAGGPWGLLAAAGVLAGLAIADAMEDAAKRTMSLVQATIRAKNEALLAAGAGGEDTKSAAELKAQKAEITSKRAEAAKGVRFGARIKGGAQAAKAGKENMLDVVSMKAQESILDAKIAAAEKRELEEHRAKIAAAPGISELIAQEPLSGADDRGRFNELSSKIRRGVPLKYSEEQEYKALRKSLDETRAKKAGKGHKRTKMDKQLAAIDPSLRGVLTGGGETDAGGDLKVHDDALSRAVFDRQTKGNGQGKDRSDGAGIGPGPNITNNYQYVNTTVTVPIDARSQGSASDNIRTAAEQAGQRLGGVIFTGAAKILAAKNAGGVMRSG